MIDGMGVSIQAPARRSQPPTKLRPSSGASRLPAPATPQGDRSRLPSCDSALEDDARLRAIDPARRSQPPTKLRRRAAATPATTTSARKAIAAAYQAATGKLRRNPGGGGAPQGDRSRLPSCDSVSHAALSGAGLPARRSQPPTKLRREPCRLPGRSVRRPARRSQPPTKLRLKITRRSITFAETRKAIAAAYQAAPTTSRCRGSATTSPQGDRSRLPSCADDVAVPWLRHDDPQGDRSRLPSCAQAQIGSAKFAALADVDEAVASRLPSCDGATGRGGPQGDRSRLPRCDGSERR